MQFLQEARQSNMHKNEQTQTLSPKGIQLSSMR